MTGKAKAGCILGIIQILLITPLHVWMWIMLLQTINASRTLWTVWIVTAVAQVLLSMAGQMLVAVMFDES